VIQQLLHLNRRLVRPAVLLLPLLASGGCTMFNNDLWDMDHYRDQRAVDIDHRLDSSEPIVRSPF